MNLNYVQTLIRSVASEFPKQFAIVTAYNPNGLERDTSLNLEADQEFEAILSNQGYRHFRCSGEAPDGTFKELGWGIECSKAQGIVFAQQYAQEAIFWIEDDQLYLLDIGSLEEMELGSFSERVRA